MKKILATIGAGLAGVASVFAYTPYVGNYTANDLPNVFTDNIGEAGVQLKTYMPLIVLGFVVSGLVTTWVLVKSRF
jgi:hypothetical protein